MAVTVLVLVAVTVLVVVALVVVVVVVYAPGLSDTPTDSCNPVAVLVSGSPLYGVVVVVLRVAVWGAAEDLGDAEWMLAVEGLSLWPVRTLTSGSAASLTAWDREISMVGGFPSGKRFLPRSVAKLVLGSVIVWCRD